jgi:PAS domain-containing protein
MVSLTTALALWAAGSLSAALAVLLLTRGRSARPVEQSAFAAAADHEVAFLFRKGTLVDATPAARQQMPSEPAQTGDLARFVIAFGQRFEGLADSLARLEVGDRVELDEVPDDPGSLRLVAEQEDGQLRVTIVDPLRGTRSETVANYSLAAMRAELFTLRSIAERSPIPTWKRRHDGSVIWANSRYMTLARAVAGDESLIGWPPPDLFADAAAETAAEPGEPRRVFVTARDSNTPLWFDLIALPGEIETLYFALPIDKLVRAENALTARGPDGPARRAAEQPALAARLS